MTPTVSEKNIHQSDKREIFLILLKTSAILTATIYVLPRAILKE